MERSALRFPSKPHSEPQISLARAGVAEDKGGSMVNTPALYKPAQPPTCYTVRPAVPWIQRVTRQPSWVHTMATCWQGLWAYRFYLIVFFLPIFLLPLPILVPTKEACCAYTIILMALLWCTEALPLAITAFLPIIMFPMMGIMNASTVSLEYLKDTNILFIGGMMVALAVENWNLHKRIALRVLLIVGVRPALLILGFMLVTAFLSMWISNTATTAMMVPIAHAVLEQLHKMPTDRDVEEGRNNPAFELQEQKEETKLDEKDKKQDCPAPLTPSESKTQQNKEQLRFSQGLSLCVCYSASIGGIATLTGTTPNLVLQGQVNSIFPRNGNVVNFASWFGFAFPAMIILLLLSWVWLQILFLGFDFRKNFGLGEQSRNQERAAFEVIRREHKLLGPINFAEKAVTFLFVLLVVLWFTREPGFFTGWGNLAFSDDTGKSMTSDGTVAILIAVIMFIVPSKIPGLTQKPGNPGKLKAPPALLTWDIVKKKMPWNIVILLGGGFALAKGSEESGLSKWLGDKLTPLESVPPAAIAFIICLLIAIFTECTSNVATTTLFLPILASMSQAICIHPLYVMLPCTLASSLAFMLPVATPPNAIAFSFGGLRVTDMARAGFMLNVIGVLVITLAINSWSIPMFDLNNFPSWAQSNTTGLCGVSQANVTTASP